VSALVDIVEAVVGTLFLLPLVSTAILFCGCEPSQVLAIAAILTLPAGWLVFTFHRYIFTYNGRYEPFDTMELVRGRIKVEETESGTYEIDLSDVLRASNDRTTKIKCNKAELETIFDPFKDLEKTKIRCCIPYRSTQKEEKGLFYVESVENMLFFHNSQGLAEFIRSAAANFHTYAAAKWAFIWGLVASFGMLLIYNSTSFPRIGDFLIVTGGTIKNSLTQATIACVGILILAGVAFILVHATIKQSKLRLKEAIANEYLLIKLMMPQDKQKSN